MDEIGRHIKGSVLYGFLRHLLMDASPWFAATMLTGALLVVVIAIFLGWAMLSLVG